MASDAVDAARYRFLKPFLKLGWLDPRRWYVWMPASPGTRTLPEPTDVDDAIDRYREA